VVGQQAQADRFNNNLHIRQYLERGKRPSFFCIFVSTNIFHYYVSKVS
jgi:hypothetical protein